MNSTSIRALTAILILAAAAGATPAAGPQARPAALAGKHQTWIEADAALIITPGEREAFLKLESDRDRDLFIEEFWRQRDPTPGTPLNEYRVEHFRRLEFADRVFGHGRAADGRGSDRGRMYILLGPPRDVDKIEKSDVRPLEVWTYQSHASVDQAGLFRLLFYRPESGREYALYNPATDRPSKLVSDGGRADKTGQETDATPLPFEADKSWGPADQRAFRRLAGTVGSPAAECALTCIPGDRGEGAAVRSAALLGAISEAPRRRLDDRYAQAFLAHKSLAEVGYSVKAIANRAAVQAYFEPNGSCFLHFAVVPEHLALEAFGDMYTAGLRTTLRLADASGRTLFERRREIPISLHRSELKAVQDKVFQVYDAVPVLPGAMVLHYRMENTINKEFTTVERTLSIPPAGTMDMTPPLLGRRGIRMEAAAGVEPRAFQVGAIQIDPSADGVFGTAEEIFLFLQLNGPSRELKASGTLEVAVSGNSGGTPKILRKPLAGYADGNILEKLPTDGLAAGAYAVEARLLDGSGRAVLESKGGLALRSGDQPAAWVAAGTNPPAGDPYYAFVLGTQAANRGDTTAALKSLVDAWRANEESIEFAVGYAKALLAVKDAGPARDVLGRYDGKPGVDFDFYATLGRAAWMAGQVREAAGWYDKALLYQRNVPAALNALGECRLTLGEEAKAREAWRRSLEVQPDQPEIKKKLDGLK
ncbi:MAG: GWxTD domain-containing protein [Candidatus Aminicenantes bacterium]|nr:GWxTD domain-containing protein [Candidatus Aminicenantes bacterium]